VHVGIQHFDRLVCDLAPSLNLELECKREAFKLGIPRFALTLKLVSATPVDIDAGKLGIDIRTLSRSTSARSSSPFAM
jgi:hypothetical protein